MCHYIYKDLQRWGPVIQKPNEAAVGNWLAASENMVACLSSQFYTRKEGWIWSWVFSPQFLMVNNIKWFPTLNNAIYSWLIWHNSLRHKIVLERRSEAEWQLSTLKGMFLSHLAGVYCSSAGAFERWSTTGCALWCQDRLPRVRGTGPRAVFKPTRMRNAI